MKGVIFQIFEDFVGEVAGPEAFEELVAACPAVAGVVHVGPATYPDEQLFALVDLACRRFGLTLGDALRAFGRFTFGRLAERYPAFVRGHDSLQSFLPTVDAVIHVEVKKLLADSVVPAIEVLSSDDDRVVVEYRSPRRLCALFEGLLQGAAEHFGVVARPRHTACMHDGADRCRFEVGIAAPMPTR